MAGLDVRLAAMEQAGIPATDAGYRAAAAEHETAWSVFCVGTEAEA
jgi:hypothetical protein